MNSGKDLVGWVSDVLVVVGLTAATFYYDLPYVFFALFFYGVFRHVYAAICAEKNLKDAVCLCDEPFWNVLDLVLVVTMMVTGFKYAYVSYAWPYIGALLYLALRHLFYTGHKTPKEGAGSAPRSYKELAAIVLDFALLICFLHDVFLLHDYTGSARDLVIANTHGAGGLALAGLIVYMVFRHVYEAFCVGNEVESAGYLSDQLFYNLWDLLVICTCFAAGFAWQHPGPVVAAVLLIVCRFILWACMKANYKLKEKTATS